MSGRTGIWTVAQPGPTERMVMPRAREALSAANRGLISKGPSGRISKLPSGHRELADQRRGAVAVFAIILGEALQGFPNAVYADFVGPCQRPGGIVDALTHGGVHGAGGADALVDG